MGGRGCLVLWFGAANGAQLDRWGEWCFSDIGGFCCLLIRWDGVVSGVKYSGELLGAGRVRGH